MKRAHSPDIVENPFIKQQNRSWRVQPPPLSREEISPPPTRKTEQDEERHGPPTITAAVEAGTVHVVDHVAFWGAKLSTFTRPSRPGLPQLSRDEWLGLYQRNRHEKGHHFVVHQHDHPVAGTHFDLRLQCNATSSISFAIMYGLPGDPNSRHLNRNATETRVHNLWNHLIETASYSTGSMLLWDTGEYEVLPYRDSPDDSDADEANRSYCVGDFIQPSEIGKLHEAFQQRKIRLRLRGTRLPSGYTIALRMTKENFRSEQPKAPSRRRRRAEPKLVSRQGSHSSDSDSSEAPVLKARRKDVASLHRTESPPTTSTTAASGDESELIRHTNAYPGATNDIGSVHQRNWYLSMDRQASGFTPVRDKKTGNRTWVRKKVDEGRLLGFEKFWVMGRDVERSVVTGRLASDILLDEGVFGYVPRGLWRPITE